MNRGSSLDSLYEKLIAIVADRLKEFGYARRGKMMKAISSDSAAIMEFQKSNKSSDHQIVFTINLGVVCGALLDTERVDLKKSTVIDAHLSRRLGKLLLVPEDNKWWELTASTDYESVAKELSELLVTRAIPYLEGYMNIDALIALWESGKSPGLTDGQRSRFLSELKDKKRNTSH